MLMSSAALGSSGLTSPLSPQNLNLSGSLLSCSHDGIGSFYLYHSSREKKKNVMQDGLTITYAWWLSFVSIFACVIILSCVVFSKNCPSHTILVPLSPFFLSAFHCFTKVCWLWLLACAAFLAYILNLWKNSVLLF